MSEVLLEFENAWRGPDGKTYEARACARGRDDGLWEGWIEFIPADGGAVVATERETTQPNRADTVYWARGLTWAYIDGALTRVLKPAPRLSTRHTVTGRPAFRSPAARRRVEPDDSDALGTRAVLDPFAVYKEGDTVLRGQLNALDDGQLRNIVRQYQISDMDATQLRNLNREELIALIMKAVEGVGV
ncbi:MAG TPA: hypothetical protein VFO52_11995 [Longimicrobiales bacterium]|nr:hypothetical protein [Longimicrobiales bacterium]